MKEYDVILFDLDGTIIDSGEGVLNSVKYALRKYGIEEENMETLRKFMGPPLKNSFMEYYDFSEQQALQAISYYREYYRAGGIFENQVYEGMPQLLRDLQAAGKCVLVATSKPEAFAREILEHEGIADCFSYIAGADMDETRVTKEQVLEYAFETNHIEDKASVLMVGDRKYDIAGAKFFGLDSVGVLFGYGSREEFEAEGATYIVETVDGLRQLLLPKEAK